MLLVKCLYQLRDLGFGLDDVRIETRLGPFVESEFVFVPEDAA